MDADKTRIAKEHLARIRSQSASPGSESNFARDHCTFQTAEESLEILQRMNRPGVKLSLHLCHELKKEMLTVSMQLWPGSRLISPSPP